MEKWTVRLKNAMVAKGETIKSLSAKVGVTRGQISHYLHNRRLPPLDKFEKIAQVLNVSPAWLQFGDNTQIPPQGAIEFKELPLLETDDVERWLNLSILPNQYRSVKMLVVDKNTAGQRAFFIKVQGNAMESAINLKESIFEGELAMIEPDIEPTSGDRVLAKVHDDIIIRRLLKEGNKLILSALNPQYQNIIVDKNVTILGVVWLTQRTWK